MNDTEQRKALTTEPSTCQFTTKDGTKAAVAQLHLAAQLVIDIEMDCGEGFPSWALESARSALARIEDVRTFLLHRERRLALIVRQG